MRALDLDPASFAKQFFNSAETDPVVVQLRSAAQMAAFARTNADLRDGTEHLAAAMQRVGLDRWPRFFADAHERALTAAPPPLDPNRPFVIGERFERAMTRVLHTPPRPGTPGAPAPILPPGRYEPGLDNLVRRIAGAEPGDLPQLYADITALYMQPGAHRAGEALIRAARDAADAGSDVRTRQEVLDGIAPIARQDPRQLAAGEFGAPGLGLLGGAGGLSGTTAPAADAVGIGPSATTPVADGAFASESSVLRSALQGKGNFGLGSAPAETADRLGRAWVGDNFTVASDGRTLISQDGLRQYRPPSFKPSLSVEQANFEQRLVSTGQWQSNGHLTIISGSEK